MEFRKPIASILVLSMLLTSLIGSPILRRGTEEGVTKGENLKAQRITTRKEKTNQHPKEFHKAEKETKRNGVSRTSLSSSNKVEPEAVQDKLMPKAKLIEKVKTKAAIDLDAIVADQEDYPGAHYNGSFVAWELPANDVPFLYPTFVKN